MLMRMMRVVIIGMQTLTVASLYDGEAITVKKVEHIHICFLDLLNFVFHGLVHSKGVRFVVVLLNLLLALFMGWRL